MCFNFWWCFHEHFSDVSQVLLLCMYLSGRVVKVVAQAMQRRPNRSSLQRCTVRWSRFLFALFLMIRIVNLKLCRILLYFMAKFRNMKFMSWIRFWNNFFNPKFCRHGHGESVQTYANSSNNPLYSLWFPHVVDSWISHFHCLCVVRYKIYYNNLLYTIICIYL